MKQLQKLAALLLACSTLFCTAGASYAPSNDMAADGFGETSNQVVSDEFDEASDTYENRAISDELAAKSDEEILAEILADPSYSEEAKQRLLYKEQLLREAAEREPDGAAAARATSYYVNVAPIMQEDGTKCGPAMIQMVLKHMGYKPDTQSNIQDAIDYNGHTDLDLIMNYLNKHQNQNIYARRTYSSETELKRFLDVAAQIDLPILYAVKADRNDVEKDVWPYRTSGHFCILCGKKSTGKYEISDSYYYPAYVSDKNANGKHDRTYNDVYTANGNQKKTDSNGNLIHYFGY